MASSSRLLLLNGVSFLECVSQIREKLPTTKLVLVSHGLDSTDYVHELNAKTQRERASGALNSELRRLGRQLIIECQRLGQYDAVLGLSQTEAEINRWLGARNSLWLPRSVCSNPIHWNPQKGRMGFVGTLDHPPNLDGLRRVLDLVAQRGSSVTIRIVGRPEMVGESLARSYRCAEYLGALSDDELAHEAGSWRAFLHPVFCVARGASTKLATGLGWGIPIVATTAGRRGYQWTSGDLIESNTPAEFVEQMIRLAEDDSYMNSIRQQVLQVACSSPTLEQNASVLRSCLEQLLLDTA
jgi:glycosyltransferase involved in cell wall biosynthesis